MDREYILGTVISLVAIGILMVSYVRFKILINYNGVARQSYEWTSLHHLPSWSIPVLFIIGLLILAIGLSTRFGENAE